MNKYFPVPPLISFLLFASILNLIFCAPVSADTFEFSGDRFSTIMSKGREYTVLSGNAKIISDSTVITASRIELYGDDYRFAECSGMIRVEDSEKGFFIEAEKMVFDRKDDISRIEGAVVMEDFRNEVVVKGNYLEYAGESETATVQIGVRILKEDMACRSEFARYTRKDKILELSGLPVAHWKGDVYRALKITVNLDTDEIFLEGKVSGIIYTEQEKTADDDSSSDGSAEDTGAESSIPAPEDSSAGKSGKE
ncbi:MAG: hypothetical protein RBT69_10280 [Spirochaetia bacterium]|nr:hypothetical protein [Spirochaetia bacterium]